MGRRRRRASPASAATAGSASGRRRSGRCARRSTCGPRLRSRGSRARHPDLGRDRAGHPAGGAEPRGRARAGLRGLRPWPRRHAARPALCAGLVGAAGGRRARVAGDLRPGGRRCRAAGPRGRREVFALVLAARARPSQEAIVRRARHPATGRGPPSGRRRRRALRDALAGSGGRRVTAGRRRALHPSKAVFANTPSEGCNLTHSRCHRTAHA